MRRSNRRATVAAVVLAAGFVVSCGPAAPASLPVTPKPTPLITPNPQMTEPASVDDVLKKLASAKLRITTNTASVGTDGITVKRIIATYAEWPLVLTQFTTSEALTVAARFDLGKPPRQGEAPYMIAGLNILVEFGPHSTNDKTPAPPEAAKRDAAILLVNALHPFIGPLRQRSTEALPLPTPVATPAPSS